MLVKEKRKQKQVRIKYRRVDWHKLIFIALRLDFYYDKDRIEIIREPLITRGATKADFILIRKDTTEPMVNELGEFLTKYNIIEYKSEDSP